MNFFVFVFRSVFVRDKGNVVNIITYVRDDDGSAHTRAHDVHTNQTHVRNMYLHMSNNNN